MSLDAQIVEFVRAREQGVTPRAIEAHFLIDGDVRERVCNRLLDTGELDAAGGIEDFRYHHPDNMKPAERPMGMNTGHVIGRPTPPPKAHKVTVAIGHNRSEVEGVFEALGDAPITRAEIMTLTSIPSRSLDKELSEMIEEGRIRRIKVGIYINSGAREKEPNVEKPPSKAERDLEETLAPTTEKIDWISLSPATMELVERFLTVAGIPRFDSLSDNPETRLQFRLVSGLSLIKREEKP